MRTDCNSGRWDYQHNLDCCILFDWFQLGSKTSKNLPDCKEFHIAVIAQTPFQVDIEGCLYKRPSIACCIGLSHHTRDNFENQLTQNYFQEEQDNIPDHCPSPDRRPHNSGGCDDRNTRSSMCVCTVVGNHQLEFQDFHQHGHFRDLREP